MSARGFHFSYRSLANAARFWWDRHYRKSLAVLWLASYPRSGNTFFRAVLKEVYGVPTYDVYRLTRPTSGIDVGEDMGLTTNLAKHRSGDAFYVLKTHDMPREDYPAIYLVRDGRDAVVSYAHFRINYIQGKSVDHPADQFRSALNTLITSSAYGGWSANVEAWTARSTRTVVVRFEDLIATPRETIHRALEQVHYPLPEQANTAPPTFEALREQKPEFFRKGRVGGWRDEMPDDLHRLFWERHGETMIKMGYTDDMP